MMIPVLLAATTTTIVNPAAEAINDLTNLDQACGTNPSWACEWIYDLTGSDSWAGVADWVLAKPLAILIIVIVAIIASRVTRWLISRAMRRLSQPGRHSKHLEKLRERTPDALLSSEEWNLRTEARMHTITAVFRSLATGFIWFVAIVWILEVVGINFGPLLAGAGIVGVALGFGTQTMVRDFIAGFFLVVEDQYGVGDTVDLGGEAKGTVEQVTLRTTRLRDVEGNVWWVPNGQLTRVANKSHEWARALLDVVVPYQADLEQVCALMKAVADDLTADERWSREVLEAAQVWGVHELGADGVVVRMVIKTRPGSQFALLRELRRRLKDAFDLAGVPFAYAAGPTEVVLRDEVPDGSAPGRRPDDDRGSPPSSSDGGDPSD
jgi:small conductance mechanosensitive channel